MINIVQQKLTQHCKAIILQFKKIKSKKKRNSKLNWYPPQRTLTCNCNLSRKQHIISSQFGPVGRKWRRNFIKFTMKEKKPERPEEKKLNWAYHKDFSIVLTSSNHNDNTELLFRWIAIQLNFLG